jgi:hypothetical protein
MNHNERNGVMMVHAVDEWRLWLASGSCGSSMSIRNNGVLKMLVIAMGYDGVPLERFAMARTHRLAYLVRPSHDGSMEDDGISGVGFPLSCVFKHDPALLESLLAAWHTGDRQTIDTEWRKLSPACDAPG